MPYLDLKINAARVDEDLVDFPLVLKAPVRPGLRFYDAQGQEVPWWKGGEPPAFLHARLHYVGRMMDDTPPEEDYVTVLVPAVSSTQNTVIRMVWEEVDLDLP